MPRHKKNGKFVNFYAKKDLIDRLDEYSERTMIPKTAILEKALEEFLDKREPSIID